MRERERERERERALGHGALGGREGGATMPTKRTWAHLIASLPFWHCCVFSKSRDTPPTFGHPTQLVGQDV